MRAKNPTLTEQADPYILYQRSVQCAGADIDFVDPDAGWIAYLVAEK